MKLSDLGEFGLIERFSGRFLENLQRGIVGIGDDAAVIPWDEGHSLLVTTDMLVEDTHFLRGAITPRDLGFKSLAVNLSDIAAMGGKPLSFFLSLGLPPDIEVAWADGFFAGLHELAAVYGVGLLGGDTTKSLSAIVINITALGRAENRHIKLRSAAREGDVVCVTGTLGDSGAGLRLLLENSPGGGDAEALIARHNRPAPHVAEGHWLGAHDQVRAMMDVSDGIDSDLRRIIEKSNCGVDINLDKLPLSQELTRVGKLRGWDARELAATAGEDYCLLLTAAADKFPVLNKEFAARFGRSLHQIGTVTTKAGDLKYFDKGQPAVLKKGGWDHFRSGQKP